MVPYTRVVAVEVVRSGHIYNIFCRQNQKDFLRDHPLISQNKILEVDMGENCWEQVCGNVLEINIRCLLEV